MVAVEESANDGGATDSTVAAAAVAAAVAAKRGSTGLEGLGSAQVWGGFGEVVGVGVLVQVPLAVVELEKRAEGENMVAMDGGSGLEGKDVAVSGLSG